MAPSAALLRAIEGRRSRRDPKAEPLRKRRQAERLSRPASLPIPSTDACAPHMRRAPFAEALVEGRLRLDPKGKLKLCRGSCFILRVQKTMPELSQPSNRPAFVEFSRRLGEAELSTAFPLRTRFCSSVHEHLIDDRAELPPLMIFTHGLTPSFTKRRLDP